MDKQRRLELPSETLRAFMRGVGAEFAPIAALVGSFWPRTA
jgi:hypothetical protein